MDAKQSQNFNERLSQWVASQGFWFQVRYSMSGSGVKQRLMVYLLRLGTRLLVFLMIVAVAGGIYLLKRTDTAHFSKMLENDLQTGLSASVLEMRGNKSSHGQLEITRLAAEGGSETFFNTLAARNIRCTMGLLDGLVGLWSPGVVFIARLEVDLKAGTDDAASAAKLAQSVFRKSTKFDANAFEVADATVRWGYSERTAGAIEASTLKIQRTETGWRMIFKGGSFHQNWLRKLEIVNLVVVCDPEGLVFEKAELKQGLGTVNFTGLRVTGGERPQVSGTAQIRNLALEYILPAAHENFLEGSISGDFQVSGSTNSADGIGFAGHVVLDGKDMVTLREHIHLLKALSVVDFSRNYHRVDFREGAFQIKTTRGGLELSDIQLKAGDLFTLDGSMKVRLPTQKEIQAASAVPTDVGNSPLFGGEDPTAKGWKKSRTESEFTLKRAAQETRRIKEGTQNPESLSLLDRLDSNIEIRQLQRQTSEHMSRMLRYEGMLRITIPKDAFERGRELQTRYPVDSTTGRIPLAVPINGALYELTLKQAEDIYEQGRR